MPCCSGWPLLLLLLLLLALLMLLMMLLLLLLQHTAHLLKQLCCCASSALAIQCCVNAVLRLHYATTEVHDKRNRRTQRQCITLL
jgi:uncharacterized membrane protein